jgi:hypothetical protein
MKLSKIIMALAATCAVCGPAFAGQGEDTTSVRRDYTLNNGVGSTGPGMSGYLHQGMQDRSLQMTSIKNGKNGIYRVSDGFSRRPVYNNDVDISLQHIR